MKKLILVLVILLAASALYADPISLGTFPIGQWLDPNYNAVWDFSSNNIRILSTGGEVIWDFSKKTVQNFRVFLDGVTPGITFSCPEAGKTYRFLKPLTNTEVTLEIERSGKPKYTVSMKKR
jgi:hypothetical protein